MSRADEASASDNNTDDDNEDNGNNNTNEDNREAGTVNNQDVGDVDSVSTSADICYLWKKKIYMLISYLGR